MPNLSKEFLLEIGGWRVLQEGKILLESGKVLQWAFEPPLLSGVVLSGTSTVNARLKVGSRLSDVENLCSCRQAREYGTVCPHVIAVALKALQEQNGTPHNANESAQNPTQAPSLAETQKISKLKYYTAANAPAGSAFLQLHVLLPLDFPLAWKQNKIRVILEASIDGAAPVPLDAVSRDATYSVYEADRRILRFVERLFAGEVPGIYLLEQEKFTEFFERLIRHEHVSLGKKSAVAFLPAEAPSEILIEVIDNGDMRLHLEQKKQSEGDYLFAPDSAWRWHENKLEFLGKLPASYRILRQQDVVLPRNAVGHFFQNELPQLERHIKVTLNERCQQLEFKKLTPRIRVEIDGSLAGLSCKVEAIYNTSTHQLSGFAEKKKNFNNIWNPDAENPLIYFVRDDDTEISAQRDIMAAGFQPGQRNTDLYTLASENKVGAFFANVLPRWKKQWEVIFTPRMDSFLEKCDLVRPEITIQSSGEEWLSMDISFNSPQGDVLITRAEVHQLLQTGASHRRLENGRIVFLPTDSIQQFNETLYDCQVEADKDSGWRIHKRFGNYLHGVLQIGDWNISPRSNWQPAAQLQNYEDLILNDNIATTLRPYQKVGVNWLHYLTNNNFAGILADEMGLGKTIEALAWLDYRKRNQLSSAPSLVVGPTSLVQNWIAEAARFTPELTVLALHGAGRHTLFSQIPKFDLIITSYPLLRRDVAELQTFEFDTVILDEAQNIKNRASQNAQCAKALNAKNRLVLTGTPMENSLFDLWSILDFLMPGYLGPASEFRDRYEIPISKSNDDKALARLQQRIRPFVLRRTKEEVVKELPAKLEQLTLCDLTDDQKTVYQNILEQSRREVFEHASAKEKNGKSKLAILTALTRLRQVCCHLDLLPGLDHKEWVEPSAKMNYFLELLDEAIDGGHRVLVFSQFVSLLKLIEAQIQKNEIAYCYMDGSTQERQAVVDRFQNNADIPVFLISLKAGGTGLNLTGADTVIHFDPWWNPAVEDQATSRAHRMGQLRVVTSYKLIARGTVEEKIVQLQQRKKHLISSTIISEESFIHSLTWDELQGLLEGC